MSLVMLYLFFAFSLAFHFFFCIFTLTQSFLRNRKVTIILTPTFLRSGLLHILVFQKLKTAVLWDSKVMWMELHQLNKQNKIIQYNLIVWLKWGSSLNGTTIRLREIYKVSCRVHRPFYFFLRSNAGFRVNISRSDAIRMMSGVKMKRWKWPLWSDRKKILHFQCFLLDCQIWAEQSLLCKMKIILQMKLGVTVTWSASLYHTHFFGCYCLFTLFINYYCAFSEDNIHVVKNGKNNWIKHELCHFSQLWKSQDLITLLTAQSDILTVITMDFNLGGLPKNIW